MFTRKDIELRSIFVINCLEERSFSVHQGELHLKNAKTGTTITKFPFQKLLALFIIGHATITTPMMDLCRKHGVFIAVVKPNLRPVFTFGNNAEANFLLRERQYKHDTSQLFIPSLIIRNKILNQRQLLENTRQKDEKTLKAVGSCDAAIEIINDVASFRDLMGLEGWVAKDFFSAYFQKLDWKQREPRLKCDEINTTLDIGYSILFNFIEVFLRMFGFDLYCGVYHRLWFKRKSLVCDLMEPFRCIIDREVRASFNRKHFQKEHFKVVKNEYVLKWDYTGLYYQAFFNALVKYKMPIFNYVQSYYRLFMKGDSNSNNFPIFQLK